MTSSNTADIHMFRNLIEYLEQEQSVINSSPTLKEDYEDFAAQLSVLDAKVTELSESDDTASESKSLLKLSIADKTVQMFGFFRRHAIKTNDAELKKLSDVAPTNIKKMSDLDFIEFCKKMYTVMQENAAILTAHAITDVEQTALLAELNAFRSIKPQVKLNQSKRTTANEDIANCVKNINSLLTNLLDMSAQTVSATYPDFVRQYDMNRKRREPSKKVTQVLFTVQNATNEAPLKGAKIAIQEMISKGETDINGQLLMKSGKYKYITVTVSLDGMENQEIIIKDIMRGSTVAYTVKMRVEEMVPVLN